MKKLISILCVLTCVIGMLAVSAVSAGAVDAAQTAVDVVEGDEVTYTLQLGGVAEPVIGCDFSFYYDSSLFDFVSISDFTGETDSDKWRALMNPDLDGEVRGNWSILQGVNFTEDRDFVVLTLKAKAEGTGHISYFIRYMYDNNIFSSEDKPQITEYKFTCSVLVNGEPVLEKAQPELNVEEPQKSGLFVNSVTGDSEDADPEIPGTVVKKADAANTGSNSNSGDNSNQSANNSGNANAANNSGSNSADGNAVEATLATTAEGYYVTATDAQGEVAATSDQAPVIAPNPGADDPAAPAKSGSALWIIIVLVVLAAGGAGAYFYMKKNSAGKTESKESKDQK